MAEQTRSHAARDGAVGGTSAAEGRSTDTNGSARPSSGEAKPPHRRRRWPRYFLAFTLLALILARASLPYFLKRYVNDTLSRIPNYVGRVEDIDVHLWRGAYKIVGLRLERSSGKVRTPFFYSPDIDLSVQWKELFHGALVGEIDIRSPELNFVTSKSEESSQTSIDSSFQKRVQDLFPLRINHFTVEDGKVHFRAPDAKPPVDVMLDQVELSASNITNSLKVSKTLNANILLTARAEGHAPFHADAEFDPYREIPTFNLTAELKSLDLTRLNDLFRSWGSFDLERGSGSIYLTLRSSSDGFDGVVKPLLKDLHIVSLKRDDQGPFDVVWQGLVAGLVEIFTNQRHDQFGAEVPLRGTFAHPKTSPWDTLLSVLSNAFIEALRPGNSSPRGGPSER